MMMSLYNFIDIHYHASPDLFHRRRGVLSAGKAYQQLNGAVVLKSHLGSTSVQSTIAQQEGLPIFPSLVLNKSSGGLRYRNILTALAEYQPVYPSKLIVHLPTITGRKHRSKLERHAYNPGIYDQVTDPETIFDSDNKLKGELIDILKVARDYPVVISTGHASKDEVYKLIDACHKHKVPALLLNQPANPLTGLNSKDLLELSKIPFVWIEQTALTMLLGYQSDDDFADVINNVPKTIYSSDLGQTSQMDISDWVETTDQWFSKYNVSNERRVKICLQNPAEMIMV